jgi:GNAT superfamily N-acetyltransferase
VIDLRAAVAADAAVLAELRWEFRAGREAAIDEHDAFVERCAAWMRRELAAGAPWRAWVAVRGGRIVGQVWLNTLPKVPNPVGERERHAYLSNLYVQPAERGGAGTALLQTAIEWARSNGVDRVVLWPSAKSVTLYARHGFTRDGEVMELTC